MASPWPVKRSEASPQHDLDALERERKRECERAHAGGKKGERARAGAGKKERERACGRTGEHAPGQHCSHAPPLPLLSCRLCPRSCTRPPSSALVQPLPLLADGERRMPAAPLLASCLCSLPGRGRRPCSFLCV
jgi:hypothetical protein